MAAAIRLTPTEAHPGAIRPLFKFQFHRYRLDAFPYDVSPDGRFLITVRASKEPPPPLTLVINWQAGLPR
jgi:hypothetical protein